MEIEQSNRASRSGDGLGLLISVRNEQEALLVDSVGVEIVDVKEPGNGPLGKADDESIERVIEVVRNSKAVSVALGELDDCEKYLDSPNPTSHAILSKVEYAKCGLAGSNGSSWKERIAKVWSTIGPLCRPVAVAYSDWERCNAPAPREILEWAIERRIGYFLLDTFFKDGVSSLDLISVNKLMQLTSLASGAGVTAVLAGSIQATDIATSRSMGFDLVAVRGAVCRRGREREVCKDLVREIKQIVEASDTARQQTGSSG